MPSNIFKIAESGIKNSIDAKRMIDSGANGLLVGESIMRSKDRSKIIKEKFIKKVPTEKQYYIEFENRINDCLKR